MIRNRKKNMKNMKKRCSKIKRKIRNNRKYKI